MKSWVWYCVACSRGQVGGWHRDIDGTLYRRCRWCGQTMTPDQSAFYRTCAEMAQIASRKPPVRTGDCAHCDANEPFHAPTGEHLYHIVGDPAVGVTYQRCTKETKTC